MKKLLLLIVTLVLITTISIILYLNYFGEDFVNSVKKSSEVNNENSGNDLITVNPVSFIVSQEDLMSNDLKYSSSFVGFSIPVTVESSDQKIILDSLSYNSGILKLSLQQKQKCSVDMEIPSQIGYYFYKDNTVILSNIVNNASYKEPQDCVVRLDYEISNINIEASKNLSVSYQSEKGDQQKFSVCFYNGIPYNNGDIFASTTKCNTCTCTDGVIDCKTNDKCVENEKKQLEIENAKKLENEEKEVASVLKVSVYANEIEYSKYEGVESENECSDDSACYTGGCSQEVCSAQNGVTSSCVAVSKKENISCKCASNKCLWQSN